MKYIYIRVFNKNTQTCRFSFTHICVYIIQKQLKIRIWFKDTKFHLIINYNNELKIIIVYLYNYTVQ